MKKLFFGLVGIAVVTPIAFYIQRQYALSKGINIDIADFNIKDFSKQNLVGNLMLSIENTTELDIDITDIYIDVFLNEFKIGHIKNARENQTVLGKTSNNVILSYDIPFSNTMTLSDIAKMVTGYFTGKDIKLSINGNVSVKSSFVKKTIPIEWNDSLRNLMQQNK